MGNVHARHYRNLPEIELTIFDIDTERATQFAQAHCATQTTSVSELIETCDAVDVCLPTDLHLEFGLLAIVSEKPTLIEKPMARTLEEAAKLVQAAEDRKVPFMVGQVVRYFPEFKRAHELVKSGAVGTPAAARTRRGGLPPRADWFQDVSRSGGILLDLAVHDFDWLRWTLGEVASVYSRSLSIGRGIWPDYALTTLKFDSGAVAHVEATWSDPGGFRVTFEVCGSEGMIEHDSRRTQTLRGAVKGESGIAQSAEAPLEPGDDPYFNQLKAFVESASTGTPPQVTGYDGFMAMSIACAALESAQSGRVVAPSRG
jgi:predicted dehydrogenase